MTQLFRSSGPALADQQRRGRFRSLKVALISDELTRSCLGLECDARNITPFNAPLLLRFWKPDLLFVESAWHGYRTAWKYKIAAYPDYPRRTKQALQRVLRLAQDAGVPTVFWNKEDGVHFDRFIDSAALFEHIFTVDENCVERYRQCAPHARTVQALPFPVQPAMHHFNGFNFKHHRANFVGSYSLHVHDRRRVWQNALFEAASTTGLGLTVYDRNSDRKSSNYRYPQLSGMEVRASVPHHATADIYRDFLVSLNVNTVEDSTTMFSRRLVEILACGGIAVTNPTPAVERYFQDYCHVVSTAEAATELFARLRHGPSAADLERAEAGSRYVLAHHTWDHRLEQVVAAVKGSA